MFRKKFSFFLTAVFFGAAFFQTAQTFGQTCTPPPSGMVAWLPGDGNAHDLSPGNNNNGFVGTQTAFPAGKVAQAFQFNGNQQSNIIVPDSPSLRPANAITIDAWVNPAPGNQDLSSFVFKGNLNSIAGQPYSLFIRSNNKIDFRLGNETTADAVDSTTAIPNNAYTHVAATYDGTTMRIYINGVLDASKTTAIGTLNQSNTDPLGIGPYTANFMGAVDELEIFNRALSQTEIQAIVTADSAGKCKPALPAPTFACTAPPSNLMAWLPGDGNANDISRNGNNGTLGSQTIFAAGKVVQAFQFNGNQASAISVPDSPSLRPATVTIDAWINPINGDAIVLKGGGSINNQSYGLLVGATTATSEQIVFRIGNAMTLDGLGSGSFIPKNTYTHITGTYDGTTMRIYVNGVLDMSKTSTIGMLNTTDTSPLSIGSGINVPYQGAIDELEIFNRALSASEIYNIYNAGGAGKCKSRIGTRVDFEGYGRNELSIFRPDANPANPDFYIRKSADSSVYGYSWGLPGDKLAPADYDGDGKTDIAVWRENVSGNSAYFYILNSSNGTARVEQFGLTGDVLTVGDYDGDGRADPAVYRDSAVGAQSYFYYRGSLNNSPGNITYVPFGQTGDKPVRGDFDGDGKADLAVFRGSNQTWYIRNSSNNQMLYLPFGLASDKLVAADYDGDGHTDIAVFRPSAGQWIILQSTNNQVVYQQFGLANDVLVPGDYDGDGRADLAVWRASNGVWYILQSATGTVQYAPFGQAGDTPVPSAFN